MKKLFTILLLVTLPAGLLSQNIEITPETLDSIIKESQACDSLRVAYNEKSKALLELAQENETNVNLFEQTRTEKNEIQGLLDQKNKDLKKWLQKPNRGWIYPALVGFTVGIIIGTN